MECATMVGRGPWLVASLFLSGVVGCRGDAMQPEALFSGDFTLLAADDWVAHQRCNYVIPTDETICSWGRLNVTQESQVISVRGFDVHLGGASGPLIHQDSIVYTAPLHRVDACTVTIDSTGVTPNGRGVLAADTLRFTGHSSIGDSLSWVYGAVQVQQSVGC
jgi:hypothetical protein